MTQLWSHNHSGQSCSHEIRALFWLYTEHFFICWHTLTNQTKWENSPRNLGQFSVFWCVLNYYCHGKSELNVVYCHVLGEFRCNYVSFFLFLNTQNNSVLLFFSSMRMFSLFILRPRHVEHSQFRHSAQQRPIVDTSRTPFIYCTQKWRFNPQIRNSSYEMFPFAQ